MKLITKRGYPVEVHSDIVTEDGYLLDMQRVPYGKERTVEKKGPIIFIHQLFGSADVFFLTNDNLALKLADLGYDIWVANFRGSKYSRKHVNLTTDLSSSFWSFS